jgi:plasmid stabilization system protein ParE
VARRVRWTTPAWEDLAEAADHIARDSKYYAAAFVLEARDAARSLNRFADRGREVPEYGESAVRELFVQSHRLIYHVLPAEVRISQSFISPETRLPSSGGALTEALQPTVMRLMRHDPEAGIVRCSEGSGDVGETREETLSLIREAIEFHIEGLREDGDPIPQPQSTVERIAV